MPLPIEGFSLNSLTILRHALEKASREALSAKERNALIGHSRKLSALIEARKAQTQ